MRTLLVLIASARIAAACSCGPGASAPLCRRIDEIKALFIGTAVATNDKYDGPIEGGIWYRFTVEEPFKGLPPHVKEVIVDSSTPCPMHFEVGKKYLVFSYWDTLKDQQALDVALGGSPAKSGPRRPKGLIVRTDICSGSREAQHVASRDIQFARQYRIAPGPPSIMGSVRVHADESHWSDRYAPLSGAVVRIEGHEGAQTLATGTDGTYEVPNVRPGKYVVTAYAKGFASAHQSYPVDVPAHGCGLANIAMFTNGTMRGRLIEQDGRPVRFITVEYRYSDSKLMNPQSHPRSTMTNDLGEFHFIGVPPGDFLLGVRIDSTPVPADGILPTYWPGVTDRAKAQIVHMAVGETKENLVIKLGQRSKIRTVRIRVQWLDGRPASATLVQASVNGTVAESVTTDGAGAARMSLLASLQHSLSAWVWLSSKQPRGSQTVLGWVGSDERILSPGTSPAEIVLVLKEPYSGKD